MFYISIVTDGRDPIIQNTCDNVLDKDGSIMDDAQCLVEECFGQFNYSNACIVARTVTEDQTVGYCSLDFTTGLHVEALCVDKHYRSHGIGTAILQAVEQIGKTLNSKYPNWVDMLHPYGNGVFLKTRNVNYVTLEVDKGADNYYDLIRFYRDRCGFEMAGALGFGSAYFRKEII